MPYITVYDPKSIDAVDLARVSKRVAQGDYIDLCISSANRTEDFWQSINRLLDIDSELQLRLTMALDVGKTQGWGDLYFLKHLPRLKKMLIGDNISTLENLQHLEGLHTLSLADQKTKKSMLPLIKFGRTLQNLVLSKGITDLQCISQLTNLSHLSLLGGISMDVNHLLPLIHLKSLRLFNQVVFTNAELFNRLPLEELTFYAWNKTGDLSFVENMPALKTLDIDANKNLTELPRLNTLKNLETIGLNKVGHLNNLQTVADCKTLVCFSHFLSQNHPQEYAFLLNMPALTQVKLAFNSAALNKQYQGLRQQLIDKGLKVY